MAGAGERGFAAAGVFGDAARGAGCEALRQRGDVGAGVDHVSRTVRHGRHSAATLAGGGAPASPPSRSR